MRVLLRSGFGISRLLLLLYSVSHSNNRGSPDSRAKGITFTSQCKEQGGVRIAGSHFGDYLPYLSSSKFTRFYYILIPLYYHDGYMTFY